MHERSALSQVKSGLRLAGLTLLFLGIAGLFVAGVLYAFFPSEHSRILGAAFLIISTSVMVAEMDRWVGKLPGILGIGVLNGLIMLSTGRALGRPSVHVSRMDALLVTLFCLASANLARTFGDRHLRPLDRVAVLGFAFSVAWWMAYDSERVLVPGGAPSQGLADFIAMGVALCCLAVAWTYDRIQRRRAANPQPRLACPTAGPKISC